MASSRPRLITSLMAFMLVIGSVLGIGAITSSANADGNNGTLKIHEAGTPSGTESNDPKVCSFNVEGFGFDAGQTGYLVFDVQGGDGPTGTAAGPYDWGPANASGYYATQYFSLSAGHYKATLYGKDTGGSINYQDEKAKSKVFKVECGDTVTVPTQESVDACNPEGVTNNVAWKHPLPGDTDDIDWSESNNGATRTATLKDSDDKWSDGTTAPKVFNLPADSGEKCEEQGDTEGDLTVTSTCESITFSASGVKPEGATVVFKLDGVVTPAGTYPVTPGSHTVELLVNGEKVDSETVTVKECDDEEPPCTLFQDENPGAPCYVEREPDQRTESNVRENCKLGGVETTYAVYTTTYSFNEETQDWESSETATSAVSFEPYTDKELKEKGCVKQPDTPDTPDDTPDNPTTPTSNTPTTADTGLWTEEPASKSGSLLWGMAAALALMGLGFFGYGARRRGQEG